MKLKTFLGAVAIALCAPSLTAIAEQAPVVAENEVSQPALKVVALEADWCGPCQIVKKNVKAAKEANAFDDVAFATIDFTDKNKEGFWMQAAELGIETELKAYLKGKPKTGRSIIFDSNTLEIVGVITKKDDASEIAAKLTAVS